MAGLSFADIQASFLQAVLTAQASGGNLFGENIFYPGFEWSSEGKNSWSIPGVTETQMRPDRIKGMYHTGTAAALIYSRLNVEDAYSREKIAEKYRAEFDGVHVVIKDYVSVSGLNTLGYIHFGEGGFTRSLIHEEEIYSGTVHFDINIMEG
jgi:hypothetical protein